MHISIIIPAYNEEAQLSETLAGINRASDALKQAMGIAAEVIVVDNASEDQTAVEARKFGAIVTVENEHNVARVRNAGVEVSGGDVFVFVDADTAVPSTLLVRIAEVMSDSNVVGGAIDTEFRLKKVSVSVYLKGWRVVGKLMGMAQGATQFCRCNAFIALKGYDEKLFMGEDVDFYWRLKRHARKAGGKVVLIDDIKVVPSSRRFDYWPLWRTLIWTNPVIIMLMRRKKTFWRGWYDRAPR